MSHRKVALFPSISVSPASISHVYSHIAGSGWSCPHCPTSPLMEVWGLITAQNSVWFGEGGRQAGCQPYLWKCWREMWLIVVPCVFTFSASHAVIWWAGWSPSCLRDFGAPTTDYSFRLQSMNAAKKQSEFVLQLWPGGQFVHQCSCVILANPQSWFFYKNEFSKLYIKHD